ncbi:MAG: glycosyltransferase family 4 protein [Dictyoglomus sp.]
MLNKILFLIYGPHPFHKALAEALNSENTEIISHKQNNLKKIVSYLFNILRGDFDKYDILLCEGNFLIPALFKYLPLRPFKKKIINISADPNLYYLKINRIKPIKKYLMLKALRNVDLFICVGEMESLLLKEFFPEAKFIVVYPFIEEERYNRLLNLPIKKEFDHNILFIGNGPDWCSKGLDILIESFVEIKKIYNDANLYILGSWDDKIIKKFKFLGVYFCGFDDVCKYIEKSSLYLHLGRGEAFSISTLEALLGGIPAIVSEWTGVREIVREIREDFVVPLDVKKVVEKVLEYFSLSPNEKMELSLKAKNTGKRFEKNVVLKDFFKKLKTI